MCDLPHLHDLPPLDADEFLLDTPRVHEFIEPSGTASDEPTRQREG
jgi:hypothetical protein